MNDMLIWQNLRSSLPLLLLTLVVLATGVWSCTTSSHVPLSVREKQERAEESGAVEVEPADLSVVDEAELQRREEERQQKMEELDSDYYARTNRALSQYVKAQEAFFERQYPQALRLVRSGLESMEMADLYALKGAIHNALGQHDEAVADWRRAVDMNPEVVSRLYPGLPQWYETTQN